MHPKIENNKIKIFALGGEAINILSDLELNRYEFSKIVFSLNRSEACLINHNSVKKNNFDFIFQRDYFENNFNIENTLFDLNASFKNNINIFLGFINTMHIKEEDFKINTSIKTNMHFLSYLDKILQEATTPNSFSGRDSFNICVIAMPIKMIYTGIKEKYDIDEKNAEKLFYQIIKEKTKNADLTIYIEDYNRINNVDGNSNIDSFSKKISHYLSDLFETKEKVLKFIKNNNKELQIVLK